MPWVALASRMTPEKSQLELVLEPFKATVVINEVVERFFGVADEDDEVESDAKQLAE
jgi:hypothetical protein